MRAKFPKNNSEALIVKHRKTEGKHEILSKNRNHGQKTKIFHKNDFGEMAILEKMVILEKKEILDKIGILTRNVKFWKKMEF